MRFDTIKIRNFHPFTSVDVDLAKIPGTVVAVTGPNGAGKTTFLELLAASISRECPTRGSLASLARGHSATLEVGFTNGASHVLRHVVDAESGKGEAFVFDDAGHPVLSDTKLRSFDAWASLHLPKPEVLYASTFGVQGSGGFLEMTAGERKAVLLRALGIERFEALAKAAREKAIASSTDLTVKAEKRNELASRATSVENAKSFLLEAEAAEKTATAELKAMREELAKQVLLATSVAEREAEAKRVAEKRDDLCARIETHEGKLRDLATRIRNNQRLLEDREEIEAAVARNEELSQELDEAKDLVAKAYADEASYEERRRAAQYAVTKAAENHRVAKTAVASLKLRIDAATAAGELAATLPSLLASKDELVAKGAEAQASRESSRAEMQALQDLQLNVHKTRAGTMRAVLVDISESVDRDLPSSQVLAARAVDEDIALEASSAEAPKKLTHLREEQQRIDAAIASGQRALADFQVRIEKVSAAAAIASVLPKIKAELEEAERNLATRINDLELAQVGLDHLNMPRSHSLRDKLQANADNLRTTIAALKPLLDRKVHLASAEERIKEYEATAAEHTADLSELKAKLAELPEPAPEDFSEESRKLSIARESVARAESKQASAIAQTSVRRAQHDASIADAERLRALEAAYQAALETTSDWELLTKYFGRDGLQALEIDAAGPELTENVNELLRACAGSRWTVSIELEKTLANGKGTSEGCEVLVTDNETGLRIDAKRLSGGQKVIVGEAMSLALSLLATKRVGSAGVTLVRDETGAALDPENTRGYVAMLRRAAQIAGAEKVLLVTHNEAVADMADSRLFIHDGNVDVL